MKPIAEEVQSRMFGSRAMATVCSLAAVRFENGINLAYIYIYICVCVCVCMCVCVCVFNIFCDLVVMRWGGRVEGRGGQH